MRFKIHGNIEKFDVKNTIMCIIKESNIPNYLHVDIDHGVYGYSQGYHTIKCHSTSVQVTTSDLFFKRFDLFQIHDIGNMYQVPVNKGHPLIRIHHIQFRCSYKWSCLHNYDDPNSHYLLNTYWSSPSYQNYTPDKDTDLYERFRAKHLHLQLEVKISAPQQDKKKTC